MVRLETKEETQMFHGCSYQTIASETERDRWRTGEVVTEEL